MVAGQAGLSAEGPAAKPASASTAAVSIAAGLSTRHGVTLVPVTRTTPELFAAADLLVVGGPTHLHRMSTAASRRWAADAARKRGEP